MRGARSVAAPGEAPCPACEVSSRWLAFVPLGVHQSASGFGLQEAREWLSAAGKESVGVSEEQAAAGLRDALTQGAKAAVTRLGSEGGFLDNPPERIPTLAPLAPVEPRLRRLGVNQVADDLALAMNQAAERAGCVPMPVLVDRVMNMAVTDDAIDLVRDCERAAIDYLRDNSGAAIRERSLPLVSAATAQTGVTNSDTKLADGAGPQLSGRIPNLDDHVTDQAITGLFQVIAAQEERIRQNPAAGTAELLQRFFGG